MAAAIGLAIFHVSAVSYLLRQGFPLDDAWIHAVYARELARSGLLAYNPGVPATGETSPLWALVLSIPHALAASGPAVVALTKFTGFGLHLATAVVVGVALKSVVPRPSVAWAAAAVVAAHPDLIVASVSGMEVPLATLVSALAVMAAVRGRLFPMAILGAMSFAARPETAVIASVFPLLFWARVHPSKGAALAAASGCGSAAALGLMAWRNHAVSGLPMPATFYVKANRGSLLDLDSQATGFVALLGHFAAVNIVVVITVGLMAAVLLSAARTTATERAGGAMFGTGLVFCASSFALVRPVDPAAFYHQRYVLPALPLLIGALPLIVAGLTPRVIPRFAQPVSAALVVMLGVLLLASAPAKARRVANDARNVDDVQVALGRALADARTTDVLWAVDAGALRYFGRPYVVDLMALNTPELLRPDALAFMAAHPPHYLDILPTWSSMAVDTKEVLPMRAFETTTPYTVTSVPEMRLHVLATCRPSGLTGRMHVRERSYPFVCAS
jgi:hypothetical protein